MPHPPNAAWNNAAEAFRDERISCCKYCPAHLQRPQWPDWADSEHAECFGKSWKTHLGSVGRVQKGLLTFWSTAVHVCGHSLLSADRKQITILLKGLNSARSCAQDNRASVGTSEPRGLDSVSRGSRRVGGLGHCPTQRQPWNSPLAQWDLPLCLWDNV